MRNRSYRGRERRENWDKELGKRKGRDIERGKYDGKRERERMTVVMASRTGKLSASPSCLKQK